MESSAKHVVSDPVQAPVPPPSVHVAAHPDSFASAAETYARAELQRRHERMESMIEKARRLS